VVLDKSSFDEQINKLGDKPQIIATIYEWSNPTTPFLPSWLAEWRMSAENEIKIGLFHFQRVGENILIVNTGDIVSSDTEWRTSFYDLPKNFFIPWHLEKIDITITNSGVLHNIVDSSGVVRENRFSLCRYTFQAHRGTKPLGPHLPCDSSYCACI
jgi:hypothetical protein